MILSYLWLKELTGTDLSPQELAEMLTRAGLNVEEVNAAEGGDHALVADVTTNRPDWLCHLGVAHEISALTGKPVKLPALNLNENGPPIFELTSVTVEPEAEKYCPRYTARVIRGITVKESPNWLKQRLLAIGQRPINNIVDITNLVCFEMNQPLHAFDLDKLAEKRIVLRMAGNDEPFAAITGEKGRLSKDMLTISDAAKPVALAGVKGGDNTEVDGATRNILLESAWFQPRQVRRTARAMRMSSESSYRFERGIDPGMTERASARAAGLILSLAGGELAKGVIDTNPGLAKPKQVEMRFSRCDTLLGMSIPPDEIERIFTGLGLNTISRSAETIRVEIPTFRGDLEQEADLIEEAVRIAGYDKLPESLSMSMLMGHEKPLVGVKRLAREVLVGLGYNECIGDAFIPEGWAASFAPGHESYRVRNPVNAERPLLRTSIIPSLLEVRRVNRLEEGVRLFEINRTYEKTGAGPKEVDRLAILDDRGVEYVRGAFETFVSEMELDAVLEFRPGDDIPGFVPGTGSSLFLDGKRFACIGLVSNNNAAMFDLRSAPAAFEAELSVLAEARQKMRSYVPPPRFPGVRRDIALVVDESTRWEAVREIATTSADMLAELRLASVYRGKGLDAGCKSLAFAMTFRAADRSLTDEEANDLRDRVVHALTTRISGSKLRV